MVLEHLSIREEGRQGDHAGPRQGPVSKLRVGYSQRQGRRKCVLGTDAHRRTGRQNDGEGLVLTQGNREHCISTAAGLGKRSLDGPEQGEQRVAGECPMKGPTSLL